MRNIFLYWVSKKSKYSQTRRVKPQKNKPKTNALILILRKLITLHSTSGEGYTIHLITDKNIHKYIKEVPSYFYKLKPAHQADFVRVSIIYERGGIWLDSDTLVLDSLDSMFDLLEDKDGFFILENNKYLVNGVFGSKKKTPLMFEWKRQLLDIVDLKKEKIGWSEIGSNLLMKIKEETPLLFKEYKIFNGLENVYPVNWDRCVEEFINKPYDNYKTIIRPFQPFIILVSSVYNKLNTMTEKEILLSHMPLNYFINKSFENKNKE